MGVSDLSSGMDASADGFADATAFPIEDLIPKKETNIDKFLKEHPDFNGKVRV